MIKSNQSPRESDFHLLLIPKLPYRYVFFDNHDSSYQVIFLCGNQNIKYDTELHFIVVLQNNLDYMIYGIQSMRLSIILFKIVRHLINNEGL